ncbi:hypothetical protein [Nocardia mangyaensis]|uniref:hypothetical protein n=1 Tax=Nocardia mangyaensis TaxID=2213200 RepID=UPI0012EBFE03|nr:hypothetical protein [Nocardia mangyaensis]
MAGDDDVTEQQNLEWHMLYNITDNDSDGNILALLLGLLTSSLSTGSVQGSGN